MTMLLLYFLGEFIEFIRKDQYYYENSDEYMKKSINLSYIFKDDDGNALKDDQIIDSSLDKSLPDVKIAEFTQIIEFLTDMINKVNIYLAHHAAWITSIEPDSSSQSTSKKDNKKDSSSDYGIFSFLKSSTEDKKDVKQELDQSNDPGSAISYTIKYNGTSTTSNAKDVRGNRGRSGHYSFNYEYTNRYPPSKEVNPLKDKQLTEFLHFPSILHQVSKIRYMNLHHHKGEYESLIMAMLFDIMLSSRHNCVSNANIGGCSICRYYYILKNKDLHNALDRCSSLHYFRKCMDEGKSTRNRYELDQYLYLTMIHPIQPFEGRIYKNLFMSSIIVRDSVIIFKSFKDRYNPDNDPFHVLDIHALLVYMNLQNDNNKHESIMHAIHLFAKSLKVEYLLEQQKKKLEYDDSVNKNIEPTSTTSTTSTVTTSSTTECVDMVSLIKLEDKDSPNPIDEIPKDEAVIEIPTNSLDVTVSIDTTTTTCTEEQSTSCIDDSSLSILPIPQDSTIGEEKVEVIQEPVETDIIKDVDTSVVNGEDTSCTFTQNHIPELEESHKMDDIDVTTITTLNIELDMAIFLYFFDGMSNQMVKTEKQHSTTPSSQYLHKVNKPPHMTSSKTLSSTTTSSNQTTKSTNDGSTFTPSSSSFQNSIYRTKDILRENMRKVYCYYLRVLCTEFK